LTAPVRDLQGRFFQDEAVFRVLEIDSTALGQFCDHLVIHFGFVAKQGQLETLLTSYRAMAIGIRAVGFRKDRHNIVCETERLRATVGKHKGCRCEDQSDEFHCSFVLFPVIRNRKEAGSAISCCCTVSAESTMSISPLFASGDVTTVMLTC